MRHRAWWLAAASIGLAIAIVGTGQGAPLRAKAKEVRATRMRTDDDVTFTKDVAPIVFNSCATCHRPGEAAPFSLTSYEDVRRRGRLISAAVEKRVMPPWKATAGDFPLRGDRRLTDAQIGTVTKWVAAGMPEGDPARLPPLPAVTEGWRLGPPDLVVTMPEAFDVPASGPDVYRNFVVPLNTTEDRWVRAVDFKPSAPSVVHHSLFFLDGTGAARAQDARDPVPGFAGAMGGFAGARGNLLRLLAGGRLGARPSPTLSQPSSPEMADASRAIGTLGGWALGAQPHFMPDGLAFLLPKGADLVLSTHFHPSGKPEREASVIGLYFSEAPPTQAFAGVQLPPLFGVLEGIDIPAGQSRYVVHDSWVVPTDVLAFNVGAHAHYLGKSMTMTATFPDGVTKTLLGIGDWDFAWQEQYQFTDFVPLPKGTRLDGTIVYDNSAENPRNPSRPPVEVTWGEQSTDEMGSVGLLVVAAPQGDLALLRQGYAAHVREAALSRPGLRRLMEQRRRQQQQPPQSQPSQPTQSQPQTLPH